MPSQSEKKINIPRRNPSEIIPIKKPVFITADKTTCAQCPCFPKEDRYIKNKKIKPCQQSPLTLYELAAKVVDGLTLTDVFDWSVSDVARWLTYDVGLHQYTECILNNHINGRRLILLEDPSNLAKINIRNFEHIKTIASKIRQLFHMEMIKFSRNMNLPERKPLTLCTLFKSRTGPSWGIRWTWNRCDILRWMKIIMPEPEYMDHWDRVWHQKPDFPKIKFCRIERLRSTPSKYIPQYVAQPDVCREIIVPRKFIIQIDIPEAKQYIWMENIPEPAKEVKPYIKRPPETRFAIKKISLTGLAGKELVLARRKMAKPKFLP
ncbi:uncharacterized protein LOC126780069 [Nymphalis io]|uniref:uncharacterized protein LOC126780069 n=1 Tax=Inachis io TaxID=171585 RepID=UPI002166E004|nr:uncharacterized protein LOC126780069 [Nymphalis io]